MNCNLERENNIFSKREFSIKRAICFPFNKEIQALARFKEKLSFEIVDFFELKYSGMINRKIKNFIFDYPNENQLIRNIEDLDVDSFDTLILGYVDKYQDIFKNKIEKILLSLIRNKKNIFSFQNFENIDKSIYTPAIYKNAIKNNFGMLFKILIPVVAIIGSSSRQGKFNLQLYIKFALTKLGYNVGFLGTEPSSELFGADFVFHCGHKTTIFLNESKTISCLNFFLNEMQKQRKDIVLTGIQGGILQYNFNNVEYFTLKQQLFLQAINPDCMILCINLFDEIEFVKRIIKFSEGISNGKVVCLVCFSIIENIQKNSVLSKSNKRKVTKKFNEIGLPIFFIDEEKDIEKIVQILIDYF